MRTPILRPAILTLVVVMLIVPLGALAGQATPVASDGCDVTLPNGETPPGQEGDVRYLGSGAPDASLWLLMHWDGGVITPDPPASRGMTDGYPLKFAFWRGEGSGEITVTAVSASGETIAPNVFKPFQGDPIPGLHPLGGEVPELDCWTFTATDGNDTLTWTLRFASPFGDCDVTEANGTSPAVTGMARMYGNDGPDASLWVQLPGKAIRTRPQFEPRDDGGYGIKTAFWRGEGSGPIALTGERFDAASPFEPHIDASWDGYDIPGFIATSVWYPTEGCWRLTATDGNDTISWIVLVESPFADCPVTSGADDDGTIPDTVIPGTIRGAPVPPLADDYYGEDGLYITLGDPVRRFPYEGDLVTPDGAISDKFVWYREGAAEGKLSITVENDTQWFPDAPEISIPEGYGSSGVQASGITFPGPGCWRITGTSGDASITFTVRYDIVPGEEWLPPGQ